jgi:hypothetical protein
LLTYRLSSGVNYEVRTNTSLHSSRDTAQLHDKDKGNKKSEGNMNAAGGGGGRRHRRAVVVVFMACIYFVAVMYSSP